MVADARAGLSLGATVLLGGDRYRIVGLTRGLVASGGDPLVFITLRDSQELQFKLAPPAVALAVAGVGVCRVQCAAHGQQGGKSVTQR